MKLCFISDTHYASLMEKLVIPPCDVLIHSGDISCSGTAYEMRGFLEAFSKKRTAQHKIFIAGNHDWMAYEDHYRWEETLADYPNITYLEDSGVQIEHLYFWGSPWTPWFNDWAFNFPRDPESYQHTASVYWNQIPEHTDVLITHGPPYGIRDRVSRIMDWEQDPSVGCKYLLNRVQQIRPKIHAFGHIHHNGGHEVINGTRFINASTIPTDSMRTEHLNLPITVDL